jgi:2-haloacid dehalogenase
MSLHAWFTAGILLTAIFLANPAVAANPSPRFKAVGFDYFVIFNANSIVPEVEKVFPGKGLEFTTAWRIKQFDYCFLRSLTGDYADFSQITADSLDYAAAQMHLQLTSENRARLLNAFLNLTPWPDVIPALQRLRAAGVRIIALSNLTPAQLRANADHAGLTNLFDDFVATDMNHTFKPDPRAYELGIATLHLRKDEICFAAFGGWDAYGAKRFGYTTVWVNRFDLPEEKLGISPDLTTSKLDGLVDFILNPEHR